MTKIPEMTAKQFSDALKRRGFRHAFLFWFEDTSGACPHVSFGGLFTRKGKLLRRATLAQLIRARDAEIAKMGTPR